MDKIKKLSDSIKNILKDKSKKKLVENCVILVVIGVIIIIAGGTLFGKPDRNTQQALAEKEKSSETESKSILVDEENSLEKKLADILSHIEGVGKVNVMITYISSNELVPAYNTKKNNNETQERDSGGGTRNIKQTDDDINIAYEESQAGVKKPIIIKDLQPVVKGVIVVAEGASDPAVKEKICKAVQVLMDIPIHKVNVFERKK